MAKLKKFCNWLVEKFGAEMSPNQKYRRLRCLLCYFGWSGSIFQFRQNIIKVGSKSWLLTCSINIVLSLPSFNGFTLKRELNFCNAYLSLCCIFACSGKILFWIPSVTKVFNRCHLRFLVVLPVQLWTFILNELNSLQRWWNSISVRVYLPTK